MFLQNKYIYIYIHDSPDSIDSHTFFCTWNRYFGESSWCTYQISPDSLNPHAFFAGKYLYIHIFLLTSKTLTQFVMFLRAMRVRSFPTNVEITSWKLCDVFESYESSEFSHQCWNHKLKTLWCFWELWEFGVFPPMLISKTENFVMFLRAMRVWSFPTNV